MTPLLLGSPLHPVNATMIATSLVAIGRDFHVGAARTARLISALYLSSPVPQPSMGRPADRTGPRPVFLAGALCACAAGLIGALAPTFTLLIASRFVLGIGTAAAPLPAAMAMLRAESRRMGRRTPRRVLGRPPRSSAFRRAWRPPGSRPRSTPRPRPTVWARRPGRSAPPSTSARSPPPA